MTEYRWRILQDIGEQKNCQVAAGICRFEGTRMAEAMRYAFQYVEDGDLILQFRHGKSRWRTVADMKRSECSKQGVPA